MAQRWCTKEDVLKDLEVVSGHRVTDVDEGYFLYGERPPPPRAVEDEDDEIELRFGGAASQGKGQSDEPGPDLIGITKMLRMVQNYENTPEEEHPVSSNKNIVITKANSNIVQSAETMHHNLEGKDSRISPNITVVSDKVNCNDRPSAEIMTYGGLSVKEEGSNILANSRPTSSKVASPVKINTNNGTIISQLNPNVKEFIPKSALIASGQNYEAKDDNCTKLENDIDNSKITTEAIAVGNADCSKEIAMMLKSHISVKNETNESQQKTNKAIVSLLRLYAEPKSAKPLKLLTPQFFEKSKASDFNYNTEELDVTDHSLERMTSIHNVKEGNGDVSSYSPRSPIPENIIARSVGIKRSENSDMTADISLYKERDLKKKNNIAFATNYLMENDILTSNEDNNNYSYDENNYMKELKKNDICIGNKNIEATQFKPDIVNVNIEENKFEKSETEKLDPYLRESINKVRNWLHDKPVVTVPDTPKSPMVCLEPVAYKIRRLRKDLASPESSNSKKSISNGTEYKPSSYAEELHKKYSEKIKSSTPTPTLNIWEKLEADLKKKDLEVKNRNKKA